MSEQSTDYLFSEIGRLIQLFQTLCLENRKFLAEPFSHNGLQALIDNREYASAELRSVESEIGEAFKNLYPNEKFSDLRDLSRFLEKGSQENRRVLTELKGALQELVSSNSQVEDFLMKQKSDMSESLKKLHQGSSMLKGYSQPGSTESCFFDKIK